MQIRENHIDTTALRAAIAEIEAEIRAVKQRLRTRWVEPMGAEQRRHWHLRQTITAHLVLRAALRGRTHTRHRDETWLEEHVTPLLETHALASYGPLWHRIVGAPRDVLG